MGTECSSEALVFQGPGRREIRADFDGGDISSDAGALLLREVEQRTEIIEQFSQCFDDHRDSRRIEHSVRDLLARSDSLREHPTMSGHRIYFYPRLFI